MTKKKEKWTENDIPDLTEKIAIITGANSGLGLENTKQFARNGANVIMACRNMEKGQKALDKVLKKIPGAKVELMKLDLASLQSINSFVEEFKKTYDHLDILLNNAAISNVKYQKTVDGFESQVGTNHLGHFALTAQLYDLLKETEGSRVINVSSKGHTYGEMDWNDFFMESNYGRNKVYGNSKLANLLFTYEMDRRLKAKDINMLSLASHPGFSTTGLVDHLLGPFKYIFILFTRIFVAQSASKGALPSTRAAVDPNAKSGEYYGPKGFFGEFRGPPKVVKSNAASHNLEDAKKLWEVSEELTGIKFEI